jgi:tRNA pseudouridine32 synthase/23S rRNA pseudouridine746 synthase
MQSSWRGLLWWLKRARNVLPADAHVKCFVVPCRDVSTTHAGRARPILRPMALCPTVNVLHLDAALIVVDKPAGMLAVPGRGEAGCDNLTARVQALFPNALVVHRLDMATSGLMLFARGTAAQRRLSMAFADGEVAKQYIAVVEGRLQADRGVIDAPLAADWPNRPRQVVDHERGKASSTRWCVLERDTDSTRLLLEPVTGRTHQLRVHLQWLGHPIRGDALYAPAPLRVERLLLHATRLTLRHPQTGNDCQFASAPGF